MVDVVIIPLVTPQSGRTGSFEIPIPKPISLAKNTRHADLSWDKQKPKQKAVRVSTLSPRHQGAVFPELGQLDPLVFAKTNLHFLQHVIAPPPNLTT